MTATKKRTAAAKPAKTAKKTGMKAAPAKPAKTTKAAANKQPKPTSKKPAKPTAKTSSTKSAKATAKKQSTSKKPASTTAKQAKSTSTKLAKAAETKQPTSKKPATTAAKATSTKSAKAAAEKQSTSRTPAKTTAKQAKTTSTKSAKAAANKQSTSKKPAKTAAKTTSTKSAKAAANKQSTSKKPAKTAAKTTSTKSARAAATTTTSTKPAAPVKEPRATPAAEWLVGPLAPLRELAEAVADLGVHAVDDHASQDAGDALRERYADNWTLGVLWSPALWDACRARAQPLRLWATGPVQRDSGAREFTPSFYLDPADPARLWYTPDPALPAALFVPLSATRAAIEQALAEFGPNTPPLDLAGAKTVRAYMGAANFLRVPNPYSGDLEAAGPHELDRHFNFSPVVTPHAWGSAFVDDPLRDAGALSALQEVVALREVREQLAEGLPRFTRRAWFSRARLAIEMHADGIYVWEVTYRPSRFASAVLAQLNAPNGRQYPDDLPLDVALAIHGFMFLDVAWFDAELAREPDVHQRGALVRTALAVVADDIVEAARIARAAILRDEAEQVAVANAALQYNWQFLLEELGSRTASAELRAQITAVLAQGIPPPQVDEHGEPVDLYDSIHDDDEEQDDA